MIVFFLTLRLLIVESDRVERGIQPLVDSLRKESERMQLRNIMSVNNSKPLNDPILYTFPKKMTCVSVITDDSSFAAAIRSLLYQHDLTPSFLNMPAGGQRLGCNGYMVATRDIATLKRHVVELNGDAKSRILCYVEIGDAKEIDYTLQNELDKFGDAEFTIFVWENQNFFYRIGQPNRTVERIALDGRPLGRWHLRKGIINNFYGRTMRITTDNCTIFSRVGPIHPDGTTDYFVGSDASILNEIVDRLNLTYKYVEKAAGYRNSEYINGTWVGGMYENLVTKKADMVACGSVIERYKTSGALEMTMPIVPMCVTYLVRIELSSSNWMVVYLPFNGYTWIVLGATWVVFSGIVTVFSTVMSHFEAFSLTDQRYRSFLYSLYKAYGTLVCTNWPNFKIKLGPLRRIFTGWIFFSFIVSCAYSSTLISHLTTPIHANKPKNVEDLVKGGYSWVTEAHFAPERVMDLTIPITKTWANRHKMVSFKQKLEALYTDRKQAIVGFVVLQNMFFPYFKELPTNLTVKFEMMNGCVASVYEGFVLRSGSPYRDSINHYISTLHENGMIEYFTKRTAYIKELPKPIYVEMGKQTGFCKTHACKSRSLNADQLVGTFYLLLLGWTISGIVFGGELFVHRRSKNKNTPKRHRHFLE